MLFTKVHSKMPHKPEDPSAVAFLMGYDSVPIRAEKSLYDLADLCRGDLTSRLHLEPTFGRDCCAAEKRSTS